MMSFSRFDAISLQAWLAIFVLLRFPCKILPFQLRLLHGGIASKTFEIYLEISKIIVIKTTKTFVVVLVSFKVFLKN